MYPLAPPLATGAAPAAFHWKVSTLPHDTRLSTEQEELRLQGLRILARMIARAYLKDRLATGVPSDGRLPIGPKHESSEEVVRDDG